MSNEKLRVLDTMRTNEGEIWREGCGYVPGPEVWATFRPRRFVRVLKFLFIEEPERWDQSVYLYPAIPQEDGTLKKPYDLGLSQDSFTLEDTCGSFACIAGQSALFAGWKYEPREAIDTYSGVTYSRWQFKAPGKNGDADTDSDRIAESARDWLGITEREAVRLFSGANKKDDIRMIAEQIFELRGLKCPVKF